MTNTNLTERQLQQIEVDTAENIALEEVFLMPAYDQDLRCRRQLAVNNMWWYMWSKTPELMEEVQG